MLVISENSVYLTTKSPISLLGCDAAVYDRLGRNVTFFGNGTSLGSFDRVTLQDWDLLKNSPTFSAWHKTSWAIFSSTTIKDRTPSETPGCQNVRVNFSTDTFTILYP